MADKKLSLLRLLVGFETVAIEPQDDGSILVRVESRHPDLLLATFALTSADALDRFDLREFPDARSTPRDRNRLAMAKRRADPEYRARERQRRKARS
jgi:hypothetical protein